MYEDDYEAMGYSPEDFSTVGLGQVGPAIRAPISPQRPGTAIVPRQMPARQAAMMPPRPGYAPPQYAQQRMMPSPGPAQYGPQFDAHVRAVINQEIDRRIPEWFVAQQAVPGAPSEGELMSPLGLGAGILTDAAPTLILTAAPQRPFRGERLIVNLAKSVGAGLVPVNLRDFKIGENSQLVGQGVLPAESFSPQAFGTRLAMTPATVGTLISLTFEAVVPPGESITVVSSILGRAAWGPRG